MTARILAFLAAFTVILLGIRADDPKPKADVPKAEAKRKPWTTSKITGSPEPPPKYKSVRAFPNVKLTQPVLIARCPGTDRLFVGERQGVLYSIKPGPDAKAEVFCDLPKEVKTIDRVPGAKEVGDLYGLVFHPKFEENRYCYVCYVLDTKDPKARFLAEGTRVSRFTVTKTDPPRIDPASEELVISWQGGGHNGGDLHFGPDGMLYISSGDGRGPNPPDPLNTGQDCSDLLSSVMRIDVNTRDPGKNYAVPKDNPFVAMKDVRPELWAFGFRNPWRMSFDRQTGDLWVGDVGWELWEMVYRVKKGGNYGWSITEGRQPAKPNQKVGPTPILAPTIELPHTIAASVTGGYVYRGKKFPELVGAYIFGDWETRRIWAARVEGDRVTEMPEIVKPNVRVTAFGEDNAGELYYLDYDSGFIFTLDRNDATGANTKFPTKLSETGLYADVAADRMAEGVIEYFPTVRQWQDGAIAETYLALPGLSSISYFDTPRPLPGQVYWHNFKVQFPKDAVLVKTLTLPIHGKKMKRVETQVLHFDGEDWRGYSYAWRDDQTDADLVPPDGNERELEISDQWLPAKKRHQTWTFHSRAQCLTCHNSWSEYALGFSGPQLNGLVRGVEGTNQLVRLTTEGYIQRVTKDDKPLPPFDEQAAAKEPALAAINAPVSAETRARSYLHANCAHCHRFGGGGGQVVLELDFSKTLKQTGIHDVVPKQGDFGIKDAKIVAPGDPFRSVLVYRMAKFGRGRMPHIGSEYPDWEGVNLMIQWLGDDLRSPLEVLPDGDVDFGPWLRSPTWGIRVAREVANTRMRAGHAEQAIAAASKLEPGPVRELFEGYFPPDPKGRKLGANPRPASILALAGDAKKGEAIFLNKEMKCVNCHKVGDKGASLGPDLTAIGKTRTRAELLDSLLHPSARVDPQFAAYLVRTKDEKTFTGLLVKRDEKQLVLKDSENKEIVLAADDVETVSPSRLSLMPDGQMSGLTPQEAADLLEYLVTRKGP